LNTIQKPRPFDTDVKFLPVFLKAIAGDTDAQHLIWKEICSKQPISKKDMSLGYVTFVEQALVKYKLDKLPIGRSHCYFFPRYYKQRMMWALQQEKFKMTYCMSTTQYQWKYDQLPIVSEINEDLV
jgi:hypothetical protein